jgi:bifunctional DNA-binding transcriptional regulator/antitoxin component of YhaV-PrlF toxin-antitoxin module
MHLTTDGLMPLTRKIHNSGKSIVVTIPSQLVEAFDINSGDFVEIIPVKDGEIKIKKINNHQSEEEEM